MHYAATGISSSQPLTLSSGRPYASSTEVGDNMSQQGEESGRGIAEKVAEGGSASVPASNDTARPTQKRRQRCYDPTEALKKERQKASADASRRYREKKASEIQYKETQVELWKVANESTKQKIAALQRE